MKSKQITFWVDEQEHKQLMKTYHEHLIAGKCKSQSDYLRKIVLAEPIVPPQVKVIDAKQEDKLDNKHDGGEWDFVS